MAIQKLDIKDYENKQQLVWFGIINKINELCDAVNGILDYAPLEMAMKAEPEKCETPAEKIKKAVAGANKYVGELAFLSKENSDLKDELERTRKALGMALDWLGQVATPAKCDDELCREFTAKKLIEIKTALGQKEE